MPLGSAIPPELMQLLGGQGGAAPQPAGADPRAAMLEALQNAMGQRSRMMPMDGSPATDSDIGDYLGEAVQTMTPKGQQPNYNNTGADPYVKFPPGGVPEPYRQDGGDLIPNRATSYNQQPAEDQAAAMAAKAVEGKGTTYPGKGGDGEVDPAMEADATDYLAGQGDMTPEKFRRKYGKDLHEFLRVDMGISKDEMPQ